MKKLFLFLLVGFMMSLLSVSAQTDIIQKKREFVVSKHGDLNTSKGYVADASGNKVCLMGPSLHWSYAAPLWWCKETVNYLVDQYHIQIIRLPVTIAPGGNGGLNHVEKPSDIITEDCYYWHPDETKQMVDEVVKAAIENDIYVIIDFHEHCAEDWVALAKEFFTYFATKWGEYPNVMYEIYHEPLCDNGTVVNYAKQVIPVIRAIDPDNIIIVGSAQWSREPHNVTGGGQGQTNIAYSWHGYVRWGHHSDWESSDAESWNTTVPVIASEWALGSNKNDGGLLDIYKSRGVINCFWSMSNIGGDEVNWSVLKETCNKVSGWTAEDMTENGAFMLGKTKGWVNYYPVDLDIEPKDEVYTEFVESTGTLTYYYDKKREERTGVTEVYDPIGSPNAVRFTGYYTKVLKAVIDPSMKNAPLTSMRYMFNGGMDTSFKFHKLSEMTTVEGIENLNTTNVTNMRYMFGECYSLTTLDLSSFNTAKVTDMQSMFTSCHELTGVDVSSFDISSVTDMRSMFIDCPKLKTIYCSSDWSISTAQTGYMFSGCTSLVGGKGTVFDSSVIDKTYAHPDGGTESPGYFTAGTMTGIIDMNADVNDTNKRYYTIDGRRVEQPTQQGVYIVNGKKVLLK